MPNDANGVPERKTEPDLFKGASGKTARAVVKMPVVAVQPVLKANKPHTPIKVVEDGEELARQLKWPELVADESLLKSGDKASLKEHLDTLLAGLNLRYIKNSSGAFPT